MSVHNIVHDVNPSFQSDNLERERETERERARERESERDRESESERERERGEESGVKQHAITDTYLIVCTHTHH